MTRVPEPTTQLLELLDGYRAVQALYVAAQLRLADLLKDGPRHSDELAPVTGTDQRSLHRLLRALASLEVLQEDDEGRFALTALGNLLRSDVPDSLRAAVIFYGGRRHWTAWGGLLDSVKSGKTAFGVSSRA